MLSLWCIWRLLMLDLQSTHQSGFFPDRVLFVKSFCPAVQYCFSCHCLSLFNSVERIPEQYQEAIRWHGDFFSISLDINMSVPHRTPYVAFYRHHSQVEGTWRWWDEVCWWFLIVWIIEEGLLEQWFYSFIYFSSPSPGLTNVLIFECRLGVVFCGRQSPGGHNIITGLFDALKKHNSESTLIGFTGEWVFQALLLLYEIVDAGCESVCKNCQASLHRCMRTLQKIQERGCLLFRSFHLLYAWPNTHLLCL
jgi:hypothetical protein